MGERKNTKGRVWRQPQPPRPPAGDRDGKVIRQRRGKLPASARYAAPAPVPPGFTPGYLFGTVCKCRRRFNAGVPGAKPPAK